MGKIVDFTQHFVFPVQELRLLLHIHEKRGEKSDVDLNEKWAEEFGDSRAVWIIINSANAETGENKI